MAEDALPESIWFNDKATILSEELRDRGFLFGLRCMTTILCLPVNQAGQTQPRSGSHSFINLAFHLERLKDHCELLDFKWSLLLDKPQELRFLLDVALSKNPSWSGSPLACRLIVTAGEGRFRSAQSSESAPLFIQIEKISESDSLHSLSLLSKIRTTTDHSSRIKTGLYYDEWRDLKVAAKSGFNDVMYVNQEREVLECTTANIFFIGRVGDTIDVVTPPVTQGGVLAGVTRRRFILLLEQAGIKVRQESVMLDELARYDEAFVTSSLAGLVPVERVNQQKLFTLRPNATFHHFKRLWTSYCQSELSEIAQLTFDQNANTSFSH